MFKKHTIFALLFLLVIIPLCADEVRIIPVKIVIDYTFCYHNMPWEWTARKIVSEAFREFRPLGIDSKVLEVIEIKRIYAVSTPHKISRILADLLYVAQKVDPPENGIVVWLTSRYYGHTSEFYEGCAIFPSRYCMATDNRQFEERHHEATNTNIEQIFELRLHRKKFGKMLAHEIGHLFGLKDAADRKSLIAKSPVDLDSVRFDEISKKKILLVKEVVFKQPFKRIQVELVRDKQPEKNK